MSSLVPEEIANEVNAHKLTPRGTEPFLKWAGGKRWFVKEYGEVIFDHLQSHATGRYIEPFLGGGSMALYLGLQGRMMLGDREQDLIMTYCTLRDEPEELCGFLTEIFEFGTDEASYYAVREMKPKGYLERAARMIYLNRLGFNGLYRKNKMGEFNVPYGKQERSMPSVEKLLDVSLALRTAALYDEDFDVLVEQAEEGDLLYIDPPYDGTFEGYSAEGFGDDDQERLANSLFRAIQRGANLIVHNADTERIRKLYAWAEIESIEEKRAINSDGGKRGAVPCLLITSL